MPSFVSRDLRRALGIRLPDHGLFDLQAYTFRFENNDWSEGYAQGME